MKLYHFILIIYLFLIFPIEGQTLVSFKLSATGSVSPIVQPQSLIDPTKPNFQYPLKAAKDQCKDSVTIQSTYSNNIGAKTSTETKTLICADEIEVLNKHFYKTDGWVISTDLAPMADLDRRGGDFGNWRKVDNRTWQFKFSYLFNSEQTWKLDKRKRVTEVTQSDKNEHITLKLNISYSKKKRVSRISKTLYDEEYYNGNRNFFAQVHQEWFYDKKKRPKMMIKYAGKSRKFSTQQLESLKQNLACYIHTEKKISGSDLDSLYIRDLLVYNFGQFGLETINFCRQEVSDEYNPHYYDRKYVSDSIFYNNSGQIIRYSCPKTWDGYVNRIRFTYDTLSNRLTEYYGSSVWKFSNERSQETTAIQLFDYDSKGIINHSKQKRFKKDYLQKDIKVIAPDEKPQDETEKWYHWH